MGIAAAISVFAFLGLIGLIIGIVISVNVLIILTVTIIRKNKISCNCLIK